MSVSDDWRTRGACWDRPAAASAMFPEMVGTYTGRGGSEAREQRYTDSGSRVWCAHCPVKQQCLEYALENKLVFGMWGGTTPYERAEILKRGRIRRAS